MPRYAAIDIGSNSARMLAADALPDGRIVPIEVDREVTRLGESVFEAGVISEQAMSFVCGVLARFASACQKHSIVGLRAVATAAVRDASNQKEFVQRASTAIGAPVEIISGQEEARLIHLGVSTVWPHPDQRVLIIDIGGGSAEIIAASKGKIERAVSKPLGAVRLTGMFLEQDPPKPAHLSNLLDFIDERLAPVFKDLGGKPYDRAIATSSTAAAVICAVNRIPRARRDEGDRLRATLPQIRKLYLSLIEKTTAERARVTGIGPRRAEIIVPGSAVLMEIMHRLRLPALHYSTAGVREGIVADLAARRVGAERMRLSPEQRDVVEDMAARYQVPLRHARRIARFAITLFEGLRPMHMLHPDWAKLLEAAACLVDTGHFVSDTAHHKHSEYLVRNSELAGFTDREKAILAQLCRFHRKSMPSARHDAFQALAPEDRRAVMLMIPLLRLADALDCTRERRVEEVDCSTSADAATIRVSLSAKADLELWEAERAAEVFAAVYQKPLRVTHALK